MAQLPKLAQHAVVLLLHSDDYGLAQLAWPVLGPAEDEGLGTLRGPDSATGAELGFYAARWYSLMRPPRIGRRWIRSRERSATGWPGRAELAAALGAPPVVVGLVLGQDRLQRPLAEDQHPVSNLVPDGKHEPFRISIRSRAARRDLHSLNPGVGQDRVKRRGELPGPVPDQEPEVRSPITQILWVPITLS